MKNKDLSNSLNDECAVFCRYLINETPNSYILAKYREGHEANPTLAATNADPIDGLLVQIANKGPFFTSLVDAFTAIFSRFSAFRKKMVLLLAILESCSPLYRHFERADRSGRMLLLARMVWKGVRFAGTLLVAVVTILSLRAMSATASKAAGR